MFEINSTLDAIFLGAFLFGLLFTLISVALGAVDFGADQGAGPDDQGNESGHDYLNFSVILAFIAWFGGVGYLASTGAGWTAAASIAIAVIGGLAGAYIILQVFKRFIRPAGRTQLDPRDYEMTGKLARVTSPIRPGGIGEIVYEQSGSRMVRSARSSSGAAIPRGTEVIVLSSERGVGSVAPWAELYGDPFPMELAPPLETQVGEIADQTGGIPGEPTRRAQSGNTA